MVGSHPGGVVLVRICSQLYCPPPPNPAYGGARVRWRLNPEIMHDLVARKVTSICGVWSSPTMHSDPGDRSPAVTSRSIPPRLEQPRPSPAVSSRLQPSPAVSSDQSAKLTLFWAEISHAHGKKCPPERDCCSRWLPIPWGSSLDDVCDAPASQIPAGSAYPTSVHDRYEVTFDRYMVVA